MTINFIARDSNRFNRMGSRGLSIAEIFPQGSRERTARQHRDVYSIRLSESAHLRACAPLTSLNPRSGARLDLSALYKAAPRRIHLPRVSIIILNQEIIHGSPFAQRGKLPIACPGTIVGRLSGSAMHKQSPSGSPWDHPRADLEPRRGHPRNAETRARKFFFSQEIFPARTGKESTNSRGSVETPDLSSTS